MYISFYQLGRNIPGVSVWSFVIMFPSFLGCRLICSHVQTQSSLQRASDRDITLSFAVPLPSYSIVKAEPSRSYHPSTYAITASLSLLPLIAECFLCSNVL